MEALFDELQSQLRKINDVLTFEFSMNIDDGKREFIISADGILSAFPDVIQLVDSAPNIDRWAIAAFRPRRGQELVQINNTVLRVDDVFFDWEPAGDGKLNLKLYIEHYSGDPTAMYLLLDGLLGEYDVEMRINYISMVSLTGCDRSALIPLADLPLVVDRETKH